VWVAVGAQVRFDVVPSPALRSVMPRVGLVALALAFGACRFDASVPATATVRCSSTADCPRDFSCSARRQVCVPNDRGGDTAAPVLSAVFDRRVARAGVTLRVDVESNEPLPIDPELELVAADRTLALAAAEQPDAQHFTYLWEVPPGLPDGPVQFFGSAEDAVGNGVLGQSLGRVEVDNTPPLAQSATVNPQRVGPGALASVNVTFSEGVVGTARLTARSGTTTRLTLDKEPGGDRALAFQLAVALGEPSATWDLELSGVSDEAGNAAARVDVGQLHLDADAPVISLQPGDAGAFSTVPGFDLISMPLSITGAAAAELCLGDRCAPWDGGAALALQVLAVDPEGPVAVTVRATDDVGNRSQAGRTVLLDFSPPEVLGASVQFVAPPGCPLGAVDALAPQGTVAVSFTVSERLGAAPTVSAGPLAFTAAQASLQTFRYEHRLVSSIAQPASPLDAGVALVDEVGNATTRSLGSIAVDVVPPTPLTGSQRNNFIYRRAPWGEATADAGALPSWSIRAPAQTFEPGTLVTLWSAADRSQAVALAVLEIGDGGSLPRTPLPPVDLPAIYFSRYDSACNPDGVSALAVPRVEWVAALNGRVAGNDNSNPHSLQSLFDVASAGSLGREWTAEVMREDGQQAVVAPAGRWRRFGGPTGSWLGGCTAWDGDSRRLYFATRAPSELWAWDGARWWLEGRDSSGAELKRCLFDIGAGNLLGLTDTGTVRWDGNREWRGIDSIPGGDTAGPVTFEALAWDPETHSPVAALNREGSFRTFRRDSSGPSWVELGAGFPPRYYRAIGRVGSIDKLVMAYGTDDPGASPLSFLVEDPFVLTSGDWSSTPVWAGLPDRLAQAHLVSGPGQTYLFGGYGLSEVDRLYTLDNGAWVQRPSPGASPVNSWRAVWVDDQDRLWALTYAGDFYWYDQAGWQVTTPVAPSTAWRTAIGSATLGPLLPVTPEPDGGTLPGLDAGVLWYATPRDGGSDRLYHWDGQTLGPPLPLTWVGVDAGVQATPRSAWAALTNESSGLRVPLLITSGQGTSVWRWNGDGFRQLRHEPTWTAVDSAVATHVDAGHVVAFGGLFGATPISTTRVFSGSSWAIRAAPGPAARAGAAMAWDPARGQVVMFGGEAGVGGAVYNDTWVWNGATWTNVTPPAPLPSPAGRAGASLVWDPRRNVLLLHGGRGVDDTWTWDGSRWESLTPVTGVPDARAQAAWDPVQGALFLHSDVGPHVLVPGSQPGHVATFNLGAMGLPGGAAYVSTVLRGLATLQGSLRLLALNSVGNWVQLATFAPSQSAVPVSHTLAGASVITLTDPVTGHVRFLVGSAGAVTQGQLQTDFVQLEVTYSMP
jgi:hypothetical protein